MDRQQSLRVHTDAADISFMLALSPQDAYRGGGTHFQSDGQRREAGAHGMDGTGPCAPRRARI